MVTRVSRAAALALRDLIERFLREHDWSSTQAPEDRTLDWMNLSMFLLAALEYVREQHPLLGPDGAAEGIPEAHALGAHSPLFERFLHPDRPFSVDTCIDTLANVRSLEIVDAPSGRREARPRAYLYYLYDWPAALSKAVDWTDCSFGIVAEEGWFSHPTRRQEAFRAVLTDYYDDESFTEVHGATALRLASFLLAGPEDWRAACAHEVPARAFVELFGSRSRVFASRVFDADQMENPFAHGETACWTSGGYCASGKQLILMVTDGTWLARLDARWDVSAE